MENRFVVVDKKGYYNIVDSNNKKYLNDKTIYLEPIADLKLIIAIDDENGCSVFNHNGENLLKQYFAYVKYLDKLKLFIITQEVKDGEGKNIDRYYKIANQDFQFLFEDIKIIRAFPDVQDNLLLVKAINKDNNEEEFYTIDAKHNIKKVIIPEDFILIFGRIKFLNDYNSYVYFEDNKVFFSDYSNKNKIFIADAEYFSLDYFWFENDLVKITIKIGDKNYKDNFINITNGKLILEEWQPYAFYFKENNSFLIKDGTKHNIIKDNKLFSEEGFDSIYVERNEKDSIFYLIVNKGKFNFADENLNFLSDIWFDEVVRAYFPNLVYRVYYNGKEKLFDIEANNLPKHKYEQIYSLEYFLRKK